MNGPADFDLLQAARAHSAQQAQTIRTLQHECLVLAMGLYGQNEATMAEETARVLARWSPIVEVELGLREPELMNAEPSEEAREACTWKTRALVSADRETI